MVIELQWWGGNENSNCKVKNNDGNSDNDFACSDDEDKILMVKIVE